MRLRCAGQERLLAIRARGRPYLHAFWHGHLLLMPYAYPGGRIAILISEHRDGELIARTMARFGHSSIRGSTTSGGAAALRMLRRWSLQPALPRQRPEKNGQSLHRLRTRRGPRAKAPLRLDLILTGKNLD